MKLNKKLIITIIMVLLILLITIPLLWYQISLGSVSKNDQILEVEIDFGTGTNRIASILKEKNLIKSELAFKLYIKIHNISNFQAGLYELKQNMSVEEITQTLQTGKLFSKDQISISFIEGKTMRWVANKIEQETSHTKEEVYLLLEDEAYIDSLIEKYWFLTDIIKNENIYYPLEGYFFPNTYTFENRDVKIEDIFTVLLDQMGKELEKYKVAIEKSTYNVHELLTIASIIETEAIHNEDRKNVSSVIYNRLKEKMSLGSDVTTYYAAKIEVGERDLYQKELDSSNPYNTRGAKMEGKLPIGPISTISIQSIEAAIYPNETSYYYFVADKNGKIYFTRTNSDHLKQINDLKEANLWFEF